MITHLTVEHLTDASFSYLTAIALQSLIVMSYFSPVHVIVGIVVYNKVDNHLYCTSGNNKVENVELLVLFSILAITHNTQFLHSSW